MTPQRIYKRALERALDAGIAYREAEAIARDEAEEWSSRRADERRDREMGRDVGVG